jgi:hypothetical protein
MLNSTAIVLALAEACLAADVTLSSAALTKLYVLSKQEPSEVIECVLCFLKDTGPGKVWHLFTFLLGNRRTF